jgi:hypothetical protein
MIQLPLRYAVITMARKCAHETPTGNFYIEFVTGLLGNSRREFFSHCVVSDRLVFRMQMYALILLMRLLNGLSL